MSTRYVTVKKTQPEFSDYLWGRLSGARAVPVRSYDVGTSQEAVTFELLSPEQVVRPSWGKFIAALVKLKSFVLILFPLFYVLAKNYMYGRIFDPESMLVSSVATVLLFAGLNIRNDIYDHISGYDRVNFDSSARPIRAGWITAQQASVVSLALVVVSGLLAAFVCLVQHELIRVIAISLGLFLWGRFSRNNSYKQQHVGEFVLFMLMGPALVSGYQVSMGSGVDTEVLAFGVLWGYVIFYLVQVNNFSHIMTSSQAGIQNSMTRLGFDRAQKFLVWGWIFFIFLWILFHRYFSSIYWSVLGTLMLIFWSIPFLIKALNIRSPMGSGLQQIRREAHKTFLMMVFVFVMEYIWYLWSLTI